MEPNAASTGVPYPTGYYKEHMGDLPQRLKEALPRDLLKDLHARSGWRHALVAARHVLVGVLCAWLCATYTEPWIWLPSAAVQGTVILGFIILLHDTIHEAVFARRRPLATRLLMLAYGLPSAISSSQFRRWHLDHHRQLGSATDDPKRYYLSPRRNARWWKALYMTPVLFAIYARAATQAASDYEPELRRAILLERLGNVAVHLAVVALLWQYAGADVLLRAYVAPVFLFFPAAFMLNRIGQHYWVDESDPAKWGTRVDGNWLVRFLFLNSNHHMEHHYYPSVPLYRLPELNRGLRPFWDGIGHPNRTYRQLLWGWFVRNEVAHTNWD